MYNGNEQTFQEQLAVTSENLRNEREAHEVTKRELRDALAQLAARLIAHAPAPDAAPQEDTESSADAGDDGAAKRKR